MKKAIKSILILLLFSTTPFISFSQIKLDTVYYDANLNVVTDTTLVETYAIRSLRKGKLHGLIKRFNRQDEVVESTNYKKGRKDGPYFLIEGDTIIRGTYARNKKVNSWKYEHKGNHNTRMELFYKGQVLKPIGDNTFNMHTEEPSITVEEDAYFPTGSKGWGLFLRKNLKYPPAAKQAGIQGQVIMKFMVSTSGALEEMTLVSSPNHDLTLEAMRVLKLSPNWVPAKVKGEPTKSEMTIRIVFATNRR